MSNDKLIYPSEDDIVDINVINNNFKILNEQKASLENLSDVARESSPKNIENKVVATYSSVNSIQNAVNTMNSDINNKIDTSVSTINNKINTVKNDLTSLNDINNVVNSINSVVNNINTRGNVRKVQRGVAIVEMNSTYSTMSIPLSSVDISKCLVILNGSDEIDTVNGMLTCEPYVESLSSTQLNIACRVRRTPYSGIRVYASWEVIEFY